MQTEYKSAIRLMGKYGKNGLYNWQFLKDTRGIKRAPAFIDHGEICDMIYKWYTRSNNKIMFGTWQSVT